MNGWIEVEMKILELEKEVGFAIFPYTRESYEEEVRKDAARMLSRSVEDQWDYPSKMYLEFLEAVKREKNRESYLWQKMKNWD